MRQKERTKMILAGGRGAKLGALTSSVAKPSVHYGDGYRIIDFTLSNCAHSSIDTLGILTQYCPLELHAHIDNGRTWNLDRVGGGVSLFPPSESGGQYIGMAGVIYQNIEYIEWFNPEYVLILTGDHIYKMDYGKMLNFHKETNADATIAEDGLITEFSEKPKRPKSNFVSMGIYIFKWSRLKRYLSTDKNNADSENDFGKNIIPSIHPQAKSCTHG